MSSSIKLFILKASQLELQNQELRQWKGLGVKSISLGSLLWGLSLSGLVAQATPGRIADLGRPAIDSMPPLGTTPLPLPYALPSTNSIAMDQFAQQPLATPSQLPQVGRSGSGSLPPAPSGLGYPTNQFPSTPAQFTAPGYPPAYSGYGVPQPQQGYIYTAPQYPTQYGAPAYAVPQMNYGAPMGYPTPQQPGQQSGMWPMASPMPSPMPGYGAQPSLPYGYAPVQNYGSYSTPGYGVPNYGTPNYPQNYSVPSYGTPNYGIPGYGVPNYGVQSYGVPNYGVQSYGVPNYGVPNYAPSYAAMPAYVSPMQAVTVLPPVAAPATIRQVAPSYSAAPLMPGMMPGMPGVVPGTLYAEAPLRSPIDKEGFLVEPGKAQQLQNQNRPLFRSTALTKPSLTLQGAYVYQGSESSARARLQGLYPLSSRVLFGATVDLSTGTFSDTPTSGLNINELYLATSLPEIPNLRFAIGQLDLTSYFDRNSFAKDGTTHFFNPIFQTNPALAEVGLGSRPGAIVNWSLTDNIEVKGAAFSSSRAIGDFALNGFAGEVGFRYGNAIIRGTYASGRADQNGGGFKEAFQIARGGGQFGVLKGDREESFGVNAEWFMPKWKMGIFGRYGRYNNLDLNEGGDTASVGVSFLDVFAKDDRLGLAYGQDLSNDARRVAAGAKRPDALEIFYDFKFMPNLRMGFSLQERNSFSEIVAGFRLKTEFDLLPRGDK